MHQSLMVIIPKPHSENNIPWVNNFWPICHLCTDYKMLTRLLMKKKKPKKLWRGAPEVVGDHQTYAIISRWIAYNVRVMRSVCEVPKMLSKPLAVLQLYLHNGFDRVDHDFFAILKHIKVGSALAHRIPLCYNDISANILVNGQKTEEKSTCSPPKDRGTRCPPTFSFLPWAILSGDKNGQGNWRAATFFLYWFCKPRLAGRWRKKALLPYELSPPIKDQEHQIKYKQMNVNKRNT